jgi:uncharacterized protein YbaR (Trm112 family)
MNIELLEILRCPFCGGRLELVSSMFHRSISDQIHDGILACDCCIFPVVDGIPVLHLQPPAVQAREHVEAGRPALALRAMVGLESDVEAERFEAAASSTSSTYREIVDALGPNFEGGYFLYRFSDPTYIVANAVVRAVAGTVLGGTRRAIDICGGSGHLTRWISHRRRQSSQTCSFQKSGWVAALPRLGASRSAATATARCLLRADRLGMRCAPMRFSTSGPSGSSSAKWCGWWTVRTLERSSSITPTISSCGARRMGNRSLRPATNGSSKRCRRSFTAKPGCSRMSSPAVRWISPAWIHEKR